MAALLALAACSGQSQTPPEPDPDPDPTVTVTETPSPTPRDAADTLTPLDAWLACSAIARHQVPFDQQVTDGDWPTFDPQWVTEDGDGTFHVDVPIPAIKDFGGIIGRCTIGGTIASPEEVTFGFIGGA